MLVNCGSTYTAGTAKDDIVTSLTPNTPPETSHQLPVSDMMEILLEPTVDQGDRPAVMQEPEPDERTGEDIAPEPEPLTVSDQVREPATGVCH